MDFDWLDLVGKIAPAVIGGVISNNSTNQAVDAQTQAGDKALALTEKMYNQSREDLAPYRQTGNAANAKLSSLMGLNPIDTGGVREQLMQQHPSLFRASQPAAHADTGGAGGGFASGGMTQDVRENMLRSSMGGGMPSMYQTTNQATQLHNIDRLKERDGMTNQYSGEKVNYNDWLNNRLVMQNSGAGGQLIAQANPEYNASLQKAAVSEHAANYDPTRSLFERLAPMLALAAISGGFALPGATAATAGSSLLSGATAGSGLLGTGTAAATPSLLSAANIAKNAIGLAPRLAGK